MSMKNITNCFYLQLILFIIFSNNPIYCGYYKCPDGGFKVLDEIYCPSSISCDYLIKINLYSCSYSQSLATIQNVKQV